MIKELFNDKLFNKRMLSLVIPITFQQLMTALVGVSDAVMLGFLNQDSLSAVSLAGQVQFVYSLFLFAVMAGVSIFSAQYWGISDKQSVEKILGIGLKLSVIIALPFSICAAICPELLMRIFSSDISIIEKGAEYLRAVSPSYLLLSISQIYLCIMKNCGKAARSSLISVVSVIVNIVFNWLLIFGVGVFPEMGITGAAIATVISKIVELIWALTESCGKNSIKIRMRFIVKNDKTLTADYIKYTLPVFGNQIVWGIGFTMYSVIMGQLGTDATAANGIANIIKNLSVCFCTGIANAAGVIVGGELGKGNLEAARSYGSKLTKISILAGTAAGIIILLVIPFVNLFGTLSDTAREYLRIMLVVCSYYVIGKAINMTVISGIFPAGGDSKFGFKCDTITMWCVTVPIGLICAFLLKLPVPLVYIIINIDEIIKLPAVYRNYKKYNWLKNLTHKEEKLL